MKIILLPIKKKVIVLDCIEVFFLDLNKKLKNAWFNVFICFQSLDRFLGKTSFFLRSWKSYLIFDGWVMSQTLYQCIWFLRFDWSPSVFIKFKYNYLLFTKLSLNHFKTLFSKNNFISYTQYMIYLYINIYFAIYQSDLIL